MNSGNRAIAITGGASGIGLETGRLMAKRGWSVFLIDLNSDRLGQACQELGISARNGIACDVTDEAAVEHAIDDIAACDTLYAVVNAAGIGMDKPAVETSVAEFRRMLDINLTGTFIVARAAARHWIRNGLPGSIVNISSISGLCGMKGRSAYGASKGGQNLLTLVLANELGPSNIRVNAVAPGPIDTPMARAMHTPDVRRQYLERISLHRYGTAAEIATVIGFLVSDEASFVNGHIVAADGGFLTAGLVPEATARA